MKIRLNSTYRKVGGISLLSLAAKRVLVRPSFSRVFVKSICTLTSNHYNSSFRLKKITTE
jgi:hypothetical protein